MLFLKLQSMSIYKNRRLNILPIPSLSKVDVLRHTFFGGYNIKRSDSS